MANSCNLEFENPSLENGCSVKRVHSTSDPESSGRNLLKTKKRYNLNSNTATQTPRAPSSNSREEVNRRSSPGHDSSESENSSAWHGAVYVTEVLLVCSVVGLALLTMGSLMMGGAVIIMTTVVPFLALMALVLSPLLLAVSPPMTVLGTGLFLAASGALTVAGFGFYQYSLFCWLYDYLLGYNPPGSEEFAAVNKRLRQVPAKLLHRLNGFASGVAAYTRFFKEIAIHGPRLVKVQVTERERESCKPIEMHCSDTLLRYIDIGRKFFSALEVLIILSIAAMKKLLNGRPEARN